MDRLMADRPLEGRGAVLWRNGHPGCERWSKCSTGSRLPQSRSGCMLHEACDILGRDLDTDSRPERRESQQP